MNAVKAELWQVLELIAGGSAINVEAVLAVAGAVLAYFFAARAVAKALGAQNNYGMRRVTGVLLAALLGLLLYTGCAAYLVPMVKSGRMQMFIRFGVPVLLMLLAVIPAAAWLMKWSYVETLGGILFGILAALLTVLVVHAAADGLRGGLKSSEKIRGRTEKMNEQIPQ